jgi:hypothetical protein
MTYSWPRLELGTFLSAAVSDDLAYGQTLCADRGKCFLDIIQLERLDHCLDFFHDDFVMVARDGSRSDLRAAVLDLTDFVAVRCANPT